MQFNPPSSVNCVNLCIEAICQKSILILVGISLFLIPDGLNRKEQPYEHARNGAVITIEYSTVESILSEVCHRESLQPSI